MQENNAAVRDLQRIESRLTIYRDEHARALQQAGVAWIDPMTVAAELQATVEREAAP